MNRLNWVQARMKINRFIVYVIHVVIASLGSLHQLPEEMQRVICGCLHFTQLQVLCLCSKQSNRLARSIINEKYRAKQTSGLSPDWLDFYRIGSEFFIPETDESERKQIKILFFRMGFLQAHLLFEDHQSSITEEQQALLHQPSADPVILRLAIRFRKFQGTFLLNEKALAYALPELLETFEGVKADRSLKFECSSSLENLRRLSCLAGVRITALARKILAEGALPADTLRAPDRFSMYLACKVATKESAQIFNSFHELYSQVAEPASVYPVLREILRNPDENFVVEMIKQFNPKLDDNSFTLLVFQCVQERLPLEYIKAFLITDDLAMSNSVHKYLRLLLYLIAVKAPQEDIIEHLDTINSGSFSIYSVLPLCLLKDIPAKLAHAIFQKASFHPDQVLAEDCSKLIMDLQLRRGNRHIEQILYAWFFQDRIATGRSFIEFIAENFKVFEFLKEALLGLTEAALMDNLINFEMAVAELENLPKHYYPNAGLRCLAAMHIIYALGHPANFNSVINRMIIKSVPRTRGYQLAAMKYLEIVRENCDAFRIATETIYR